MSETHRRRPLVRRIKISPAPQASVKPVSTGAEMVREDMINVARERRRNTDA